jgi:hypothetical protein
MTKITAIKECITTEDKIVIVEVVGMFIPSSLGSRDRYGVPLEPDEPDYFEIDEVIIENVQYDDEMLSKLLGVPENQIEDMLQDFLGEAYEDYVETCQENAAINRLDNMRFLDDNW